MNRHNVILWIYAIVGIPGLPLACAFWLIRRYILGNRDQTKEDFLSYMMTFSIFTMLMFSVIYFTSR